MEDGWKNFNGFIRSGYLKFFWDFHLDGNDMFSNFYNKVQARFTKIVSWKFLNAESGF